MAGPIIAIVQNIRNRAFLSVTNPAPGEPGYRGLLGSAAETVSETVYHMTLEQLTPLQLGIVWAIVGGTIIVIVVGGVYVLERLAYGKTGPLGIK